MEVILTPEQMRKADEYAIKELSIPSALLMENAAKTSSDFILDVFENFEDEFKIIILCGCGNNGGDGFALARHLHEYFEASVYWFGDTNKMSAATKTNFDICSKLEIELIKINYKSELSELDFDCDCLIDAMIGVGGSEKITGLADDILSFVKELDVFKIALDVPTGLNSLNGFAAPNCFEADLTITMYSKKLGLMLNDGPDVCGDIFTAELGAPTSVVEKFANNYSYDHFDLYQFFSERERKTSKFDYGRVVIIAGSEDYPGAAALCANAAITAGAGLVELFTEKIHPSLLPEIIIHSSPDSSNYFADKFDDILSRCQVADAILIGPGLGKENIEFAKRLISSIDTNKKIILDADAIYALDFTKKYTSNIIITPHIGEFSKLTGLDIKSIAADSHNQVNNYARNMNLIIHLKNHPSLTSDGIKTFLTNAGNPGMATAGSGDVLSGFIASLLAQGYDTLIAASFGAYIHAICGDYYVSNYDETTLTASKLIDCLPMILDFHDDEE